MPSATIGTSPADDAEVGTVHIPAFDLPPSIYMSDAARAAFCRRDERLPRIGPDATIAEYRAAMDAHFYQPRLARALEAFPCEIVPEQIAGVWVDRITPSGGIKPENARRLLINLHGGGFRVGAGAGALLESVPIAAAAGIEVVSIDYRQGPEHEFPAASEDVAAVYHSLLPEFAASAIGIFGVSAGGVLTAMSVAWFDRHSLPKPGAIALVSAPADNIWGGDSRFWVPPMFGMDSPTPDPNPPPTGMPYVKPEDLIDSMVSPVMFSALLSRFPPTLVITGTRAGEMSAAVASHSRLVRAGVQAELHVWEGMWHGFTEDFELPEAEEARGVVQRFFDRHLSSN